MWWVTCPRMIIECCLPSHLPYHYRYQTWISNHPWAQYDISNKWQIQSSYSLETLASVTKNERSNDWLTWAPFPSKIRYLTLEDFQGIEFHDRMRYFKYSLQNGLISNPLVTAMLYTWSRYLLKTYIAPEAWYDVFCALSTFAISSKSWWTKTYFGYWCSFAQVWMWYSCIALWSFQRS